jgi:signal transduction histidine kinase
MDIYALSGLINAILFTALSIFVFLKNPKSSLNIKYSVFIIFAAIWSFFYFLWFGSNSKSDALLWSRALMCGSIFIPVSFLNFVLTFLDIYQRKKKFVIFGYAIFFIFLLSDFTSLFVRDVVPKMTFRFWPEPGLLFTPFLILWFFYSIYSCYLLFEVYKISAANRRNQIKYVLVAMIIGFICGSTSFFLWYDIQIPPFGNPLIPISVGLMAYAIFKYRLLDIRLAVTRAGLFAFVYLPVLGVPFYIGYRLLGNSSLWYVPIAVGTMCAFSGPLIYQALKKRAEDIILAEQKRYQNILLQASEGMAREHDLKQVLKFILKLIQEQVKIKFAVAYIYDNNSDNYKREGLENSPIANMPNLFLSSHPLVEFIKTLAEPYSYDHDISNAKIDFDRSSDIGLIIPLLIQTKLIGFILLGSKLNMAMYSDDDIKVFRNLSQQMALAIENCLYLEESKKTQERLFTAEKLASIGGMAEGLAHQIMNRLNQFALNSEAIGAKVKKFQTNNPDASSKTPDITNMLNDLSAISNSLAGNVSRTTDIVKGILSYSNIEIKEQDYSSFRLSEIVNPALELIKIKHNVKDIPLQIVETKAAIFGIKAQLMEVIYNLIDNAYEATSEKRRYLIDKGQDQTKYRPEIKISLAYDKTEFKTTLEITDNGIGIKEENKSKIFAPFFTTKPSSKSGSGIGMYIAKRMIEEVHNGSIRLKSEYLLGTSLYITLRNPSFQ